MGGWARGCVDRSNRQPTAIPRLPIDGTTTLLAARLGWVRTCLDVRRVVGEQLEGLADRKMGRTHVDVPQPRAAQRQELDQRLSIASGRRLRLGQSKRKVMKAEANK